ncbi:MAG: IS66 family transposase [Deltaproteobacteria bacterium]|jgi:transposase|nr:IS66 family transposase [Deltaproteobacteria bacterium]
MAFHRPHRKGFYYPAPEHALLVKKFDDLKRWGRSRKNITPEIKVKEMMRETKIIDGILKRADVQKDSSNSSLSPGKDLRKSKGKKPREKTKRKPGGQKGHPGATIALEPNPDVITTLQPEELEKHLNNPDLIQLEPEIRQEKELVASQLVTNYEAFRFQNRESGEIISAKFPDHIKGFCQFGLFLQACLVLIRIKHFEPFGRGVELIEDIGGPTVGKSTFISIFKRAAQSAVLAAYKEACKISLLLCLVLYADETGANVDGKNNWIFFVGGGNWVRFFAQKGRGMADINECGILPNYTGTIAHDCFKAYFNYGEDHQICLAHLLRELKADIERGSVWASKMSALLKKTIDMVDSFGGVLPEDESKKLRKEYEKILREGDKETESLLRQDEWVQKEVKPGRIARPKTVNLLERFKIYENYVLNFTLYDYVEPTNNFSERLLRPIKLHANNSRCFRSFRMAEEYCDLKGYIITCGLHGIKPIDAITMLLENKTPPFILECLDKHRA